MEERTREDIIQGRRDIAKASERSHTFNVGDRRVHSPRICVMCARPLANLVLHKQAYVTIIRHTRYHVSKVLIFDMCTSINSCYRKLSMEGRLIE